MCVHDMYMFVFADVDGDVDVAADVNVDRDGDAVVDKHVHVYALEYVGKPEIGSHARLTRDTRAHSQTHLQTALMGGG